MKKIVFDIWRVPTDRPTGFDLKAVGCMRLRPRVDPKIELLVIHPYILENYSHLKIFSIIVQEIQSAEAVLAPLTIPVRST